LIKKAKIAAKSALIFKVALILCIAISLLSPVLYKRLMREYLSSKVVLITAESLTKKPYQSGGTGFFVTGPSGKTYIMTNRHVCNLAQDGKVWVKVIGRTSDHQVKMLESSNAFDLCLLESFDDIEGIYVGNSPEVGQDAITVGHPRLQPRTYSTGEVVGYEPITITAGIVGKTITEEQCKTKDSFTRMVPEVLTILDQMHGGVHINGDVTDILESLGIKNSKKVKVCYQRNQALVTTLFIYPGASGSPVVDMTGKLIGVIYAGLETGGWGYAVTLSDIKTLLKGR
jgi:S1-C subfamily serine protease